MSSRHVETPWVATSAFDFQRWQSIRDLYVITGTLRTTAVLGKLAYRRAERGTGQASCYRGTVLENQKHAS